MEKKVVKDFRDGPKYHIADPNQTNRALCGATTVPTVVLAAPKWGVVNPLVQEEFCKECEKLGKPKKAAARKAGKKGKAKK